MTDFGRTRALVESASLSAQAQQQDVDARRADVLLDVDRAYFGALRAQAVLAWRRQTVDARQLVVDQVTRARAEQPASRASTSASRKVNLGEAQLLLRAGAERHAARVRDACRRARGAATAAYDAGGRAAAGRRRPPTARRSSPRRCATGPMSPRQRLAAESAASSPTRNAVCGCRRSPSSAPPG